MNDLAWFIGGRYARGRERNRFGSLVSLFSLLGMAIGVAALIIVLSVMNGFQNEIAIRFQSIAPHLSVFPKPRITPKQAETLGEAILAADSIEQISPGVSGFAMLAVGETRVPATVTGIDPGLDREVTDLPDRVVNGALSDLNAGEFGLVLGSQLARTLWVTVGDTINMVLPELVRTPGGVYSRQKKVKVVAIFETGSQLDANTAFLHLADAKKLFRKSSLQKGYRIRLNNIEQADLLYQSWLQKDLDATADIQLWSEGYESLFRAMRTEKITVGLLLLVIIVVAAFNIISGLVMMVSDKRADMAVLRTMGAGRLTLVKIFFAQGLILGGVGIVAGAVFGSLTAIYLPAIVQGFEALTGTRIFDPNVYYVSFLPTQWQWGDVFWVLLSATLLNLVATLIPAWHAAGILPTEALAER